MTLVNHSSPRNASETRGLVFEKRDIRAEILIQDDGRTLKIVVTDPQDSPAIRHKGPQQPS